MVKKFEYQDKKLNFNKYTNHILTSTIELFINISIYCAIMTGLGGGILLMTGLGGGILLMTGLGGGILYFSKITHPNGFITFLSIWGIIIMIIIWLYELMVHNKFLFWNFPKSD